METMVVPILVALIAVLVAVAYHQGWLRAIFSSGKKEKLDKSVFHEFHVIGRREVTSAADRKTLFLTFGLPRSKDLPCGAHVKLAAAIDGTHVERSYTPTRFDGDNCELLFRVYPQGKMTQHLHTLQVGDTIQMKGPTGLHRYGEEGPGSFREGRKKFTASRVALVAGGTGITPMLQIANTVLGDPADDTEITILACNSTPDDVMLYEEINRIATQSHGKIKVVWAVSKERAAAPEDASEVIPYPWPHTMGRISVAMIQEQLPPPGEDTIACLCGPPGFNKAAQAALAEAGYGNVLTW